MKKLKTITTKLLITFVLISIGFALGKYYTGRDNSSTASAAKPVGSQATVVRVYYMHTTFRCSTCNKIERMTKDLLKTHYADAMANGRIEFESVDFQNNAKLTEQFDIISSCVVVTLVVDGKIIKHQRLDEVWTLLATPDKFNAYISKAIDKYTGYES